MTYKRTGRAVARFVGVGVCFCLVAACTPIQQPQQGFIASTSAPRATQGPPPVDAKGTQSALNLQAQIVAATSQAGAIQATSGAATASWQAGQQATQAVSMERTWTVQGWTATAAVVQSTATERARSTATALNNELVLHPTETGLARKMDSDAKAAALKAQIDPVVGWGWALLRILLLAAAVWGIVELINHVVPALADKLRGINFTYDANSEDTEPVIPAASAPHWLVEGSTGTRVQLPLSDDQLYTLAHALMRGVPFSEKNFTPKAIPNFREVQDAALAQGLAEWRNREEPRQGVTLTEKGIDFFQRLLTVSPLPLPGWTGGRS